MSKVDAQRAMREAKYARNSASGPTRREAAAAAASRTAAPTAPTSDAASVATPPAVTKAPASKKPAAVPAGAAAAPEGGLCGHRSMNGRACTRPAGHSEKNHRYG